MSKRRFVEDDVMARESKGMNEKEFLKEHPSLKGKMINETLDNGKVGWCYWQYIHETQIEKQKVKDVIDRLIGEMPCMVGFSLSQIDDVLEGKPYRFEFRNALMKYKMKVDLAEYHDRIEKELGVEDK